MSDSIREETRKRVLLVDDEPAVRKILAETLQEAGYEVGAAENGAAGLQTFRDGTWDVVVTDRMMPVMDGEEMSALIRRTSPSVPIILITGILRSGTDMSNFSVVLQKPFRASHLLNAIEAVTAETLPAHL